MPEIEIAVCVRDKHLVEEQLSIDDVRRWGRPAIDKLDFYCFECGTRLSPVIGRTGSPLKHSPHYRVWPRTLHQKYCPYFDSSNIRRTSEKPEGSQYAADDVPSVFEPFLRSAATSPKIPGVSAATGNSDFNIERMIRLRTRSLERLARHYQQLRGAGADAPLTLRSSPGTTYMTVVRRMAELDANYLKQGLMHVYVGLVGSVIEKDQQLRVFFRTGGIKSLTGHKAASLRASVLIKHNLSPPHHLESVLTTLRQSGQKILYAVGSFRAGGNEGAFTITPESASMLYAALLAQR